MTVNFNGRNDRDGTAITAPTIAGDGTAVDHTINTDGTANVSCEWSWGGTNADIDGFMVYVHQDTAATAYTFGTTPATEAVYFLAADKRAFILYGVPADRYYTFGVRAYRQVDPDIAASRLIQTAIVKPSLAAENPYRPASSVAFAGNVTGTVNGIAAASVNVWSAVTGSGKPADNATRNTIYRQATAPASGMAAGISGSRRRRPIRWRNTMVRPGWWWATSPPRIPPPPS